MSKPLVLDLYCGGGGASRGLVEAGYFVVGIDSEPQPDYPYPFLRMNALYALDLLLAGKTLTFGYEGIRAKLTDFAGIHTSPPCQAHTRLRHRTGITYLDLVPDTRERLVKIHATYGIPYTIENVEDAPLIDPVVLCGTMFGLGAQCSDGWRDLWRHRKIESSFPMSVPRHCLHDGSPVGVYGNGGGGMQQHSYKGLAHESRQAMGIDWLPRKALSQAIPPAYGKWIGEQMRPYLSL